MAYNNLLCSHPTLTVTIRLYVLTLPLISQVKNLTAGQSPKGVPHSMYISFSCITITYFLLVVWTLPAPLVHK